MDIGNQIKKYRLDRKMTAKQLGELVNTSPNNIYRYESGKYHPSLTTLSRIAAALNCTVEVMLRAKG